MTCYTTYQTNRYIDSCDAWESLAESYEMSSHYDEDVQDWLVFANQYALIADGATPEELLTEDDYRNSYEYENAVERMADSY